jgi:lysophospholipase L1-like esterase
MVTRLLFEDEIEQMNPTSLLDVQAASRPTAVLFGDSMSEYVGYKADGTPDDKYGGSVADVIANNLGIQVQNLATGGETSNEALAGGAKFGAFQSYIEQNKPQYAIIRYGAADAIKNQDPAVTLQSVQQMVDIAKANGVTPIIVGVSELYGAQNSKTGNIAGYIDPGAEQRANQINAGLKQLAEANGLSFTDVREATSAGQGDLLDGVHTNADFGKKMADAISEDIAAKNVIAEARVPQLPPNVDSLSNEEKGRLYNDFISQGFTDAQIRTAARAESDQDWNALKRIAADVRNTTPAAIEQQATMQTPQGAAAQPEGLLSGQAAQSQANRLDLQSLVTPEDAANIRSAYEIGAAYPIVRGNEVYSFNPDGSIEYTRMNPSGIGATIGLYSSTGEEIVPQYYNADFGKTSNATRLLQAGLAAGIGGILGPAGAGLLSAPLAAATGAGLTSYGVTGDLESALKAAALGG